MHKVIVINLSGNAYQIDEDGYHALRAYLDRAAAQLAGNPDRTEILLDLEQAIADKCQRFLSPQKTVVLEYKRAYEARFKQDVSTFGGHAYDGLMLAVEAMKRAGSTDRKSVCRERV